MADLTIMVAPNGARKGHADHPNLPITIEATAKEALACQAAGAQAIHMHVRDDEGRHTLDAPRYIAATEAVRRLTGPDFVVQITTEAVGMFKPHEQIAVVRAVQPEAVSIATKELIPDASEETAAAELYRWAYDNKIAVQHIVYAAKEFEHLLDLMTRGIIHGNRHSVIFPLGRYATAQESDLPNSFRSLRRFRRTVVLRVSTGGCAPLEHPKQLLWLRRLRWVGIAGSVLRTASPMLMAASRRAMQNASRICRLH